MSLLEAECIDSCMDGYLSLASPEGPTGGEGPREVGWLASPQLGPGKPEVEGPQEVGWPREELWEVGQRGGGIGEAVITF